MRTTIPSVLAAACAREARTAEWLTSLPEKIGVLCERWRLDLSPPFENASCAWVAPARQNERNVVLKLGMPHMEGADELLGLQFWNGEAVVRIFDADPKWNAMLLERCEPGIALRSLPESDQDSVVANLLQRCRRKPEDCYVFRPLAAQLAYWGDETRMQSSRWLDRGLVLEGLRLFEKLSVPSPGDVLLTTDLHAGNILRAQREPWLVIDPKPFIGDPAYDVTQHLLNCRQRLQEDPGALVDRMADLAEVDTNRAKLWLFARIAAEPRDDWDDGTASLARQLG